MNGHDTDPTPPHGIERPPTPKTDLREHYSATLGRVHAFTDHDRAVLLTVTDALDALALVISAWHTGDGDTLRDALTASGRDWFGWFRCPSCHAETAAEERGVSGYCLDCDAAHDDDIAETIRANAWEIATETGDLDEPCAGCGESGRLLDSESVCLDCLHDDQDRDAYGAPYGGRDDLDDNDNYALGMPGDNNALPHDDTPSVRGWWEDR